MLALFPKLMQGPQRVNKGNTVLCHLFFHVVAALTSLRTKLNEYKVGSFLKIRIAAIILEDGSLI